MRFTVLGVLATSVLVGCNTVDDIRQAPIAWTATYAGNFDSMANCLAGQAARDFDVTPQIYQSEQRAMVTLGAKGTYSLVAEYQVRQIAPQQVEVTWRTVSGIASSQAARARADRCARDTLASMPRPAPVYTTTGPAPAPVWAPER